MLAAGPRRAATGEITHNLTVQKSDLIELGVFCSLVPDFVSLFRMCPAVHSSVSIAILRGGRGRGVIQIVAADKKWDVITRSKVGPVEMHANVSQSTH